MKRKREVLLVLTVAAVLCGCTFNRVWQQDGLPEQATEQVQSIEPAKDVESISEGNYAYECLDDAEKRAYDEILDCLLNQEEKVTVETESPEELQQVYNAVMADYGEIFWNSGYVYTLYTQEENVVGMEFAPQYTKNAEERQTLQLEVEQAADEIVQGIRMDATDYEKAKYVFDYLVTNVEYAADSAENQNILSVFLYKSTVCQGYSCATQYLLKKLDIPSTIINGKANGESHAWNLVLLDGAYYYIDTTWGNAAYLNEDAEHTSYINYNYFAVTSEELFKTHTPEVSFPLPDCVETADNYYIREGRYFSEWQPQEAGELLKAEYEGERRAVSLKFQTKELYDRMKAYLIDEQHIADYCAGITTVYYIEDTQQNVLTINFTETF